MRKSRPGILIAGGFDPSGGAGILADAKTAETLRVQASCLITAQTVQSAVQADRVEWTKDALLAEQCERLMADAPLADEAPRAVKLGLLRDAAQAQLILDRVLDNESSTALVWDPVLGASAGLDFHAAGFPAWQELLRRVTVFTPNRDEMQRLMPEQTPEEAAAYISRSGTAVLLKGGHDSSRPGYDQLFIGGQQRGMRTRLAAAQPKHGSGCVLATALAAYLARGFDLPRAALRAKRYTERFLASTPTLLGYHAA